MNVRYDRICPICEADVRYNVSTGERDEIIVRCDRCGKYAMSAEFYEDYIEQDRLGSKKSEIASYLYYHSNNTTVPCICGNHATTAAGYRCVTISEIQNWYPKTFSEKVDTFLLGMASRANYMSEPILFTPEKLESACFVVQKPDGPMRNMPDIVDDQVKYFLKYLKDQKYIDGRVYQYLILPEGLERIDALQKNHHKTTKNVFVAMSFAPNMKEVREAIKKALVECGYTPRIMDEIEHNHQIVPEMLYEIREARFVVAELTGHNNGAYFEAGYALGHGKEVIQICQKSKFGEDGHFDVKQVNTVLWETTEDLTTRLIARIKATIS